ncbi:MAG TPA: diguanylate cyclase [Halothiobacillus sp.]|nr:diguanylate cyclase [Halothiobacillus sp.]
MDISPKRDFMIGIPGGAAFVLGLFVLLGWVLDMPLLAYIDPDWKPMVPGTALCFAIGGLALLASVSKVSGILRARARGLLIGMVLLLAGARGMELLLTSLQQTEFTAPLWVWLYKNQGQMSIQTVFGFLAFVAGYHQLHWGKTQSRHLFARIISVTLIVLGLATVFAYAIKLPYLFESEFFKTGLIWLSLPTAIGLTLLGLGLWGVARQHEWSDEQNTDQTRAGQIYRATVLVVTLTTLTTGAVGIMFLEEATLAQSKVDMTQTIETKQAHLASLLEDHIERALLASTDPSLMISVHGLLQNIRHRVPITVQTQIADRLIQHGFTGVGLESGNQTKTIIGTLLPDSVKRFPLRDYPHAFLIWDKGYYLRMRIPVTGDTPGSPDGYLIIEQAMPRVSKLIDDANHWGETGTLPMCGRLNADKLLCYPQREQADLYVIPDKINGMPIPMTYALGGKHAVSILTDYRGRHVLAAYGPVDHSGLGLVLKMDLSEVYDPVKKELLFLLPLIAVLTLMGLGLIQLRARPLLEDLAQSHESEKTARSRFEAAMDSSPDIFIIYEAVRDDAGVVIDFRATFANKNATTNTRLTAERLTGHSCVELFPEQKGLIENYRTVLKSGKPLINECTSIDAEGNTHWYQRQVVAMPSGVATTFRNITQEKRLFEDLDYSNQLRTAIVESSVYSIISTDVQGTILTFNKAAERMLWYRADEMIGKKNPGVFHDAEEVKERAISLSQELGYPVEPGFEVFVAKPKIHEHEDREWTYVRKDGSRFPVRLSVTALRGPQNKIQGFLGIAYDISEQKRADEYIRHIALHDALTGLPNRMLLDDRVTVAIEQQRRNGTPFALAMMDIDRFKHINDSMGHHTGDKVLKEFVARVQTCLRLTDTIARMGGR